MRRDELIAAVSKGTLALECGVKSGTMHTVDFAKGISRPVACFLPEDAGSSFEGCRTVVGRDRGIRIVTPVDLQKFVSAMGTEDSEDYKQTSLFN